MDENDLAPGEKVLYRKNNLRVTDNRVIYRNGSQLTRVPLWQIAEVNVVSEGTFRKKWGVQMWDSGRTVSLLYPCLLSVGCENEASARELQRAVQDAILRTGN